MAGSGYWTYTKTAVNPAGSVAALKFVGYQEYNTDHPLASEGFTTLNFEPSNNGTVTPNEWQQWTIDDDSLVWQSNAGDNFCQIASPCTLAEFASQYPQGAWGQVQIGLSLVGATSFVDAVTIAEGATTFGYNFEAPATPTPTPTRVDADADANAVAVHHAVRARPWRHRRQRHLGNGPLGDRPRWRRRRGRAGLARFRAESPWRGARLGMRRRCVRREHAPRRTRFTLPQARPGRTGRGDAAQRWLALALVAVMGGGLTACGEAPPGTPSAAASALAAPLPSSCRHRRNHRQCRHPRK